MDSGEHKKYGDFWKIVIHSDVMVVTLSIVEYTHPINDSICLLMYIIFARTYSAKLPILQ